LRRGRQFIGTAADFIHVKSDGKDQSRQTEQDHADEGDPTGRLGRITVPTRSEEQSASDGQTKDPQQDEEERTKPFGGERRRGANGTAVADFLTRARETEFHVFVFRDDPLGIRQGGDGENVRQEEQTSRDDRQFVHGG